MILRAIIMAGASLTLRGRQDAIALLPPSSATKLSKPRPPADLAPSAVARQVPKSTKRTKEGRLRAPAFWTHVRYWAIVRNIRSKGGIILSSLNARERQAYLAVRDNGLFDELWYLEQNPDVAAAGVDPLHHLITHGIHEGRAPNGNLAAIGETEATAEARARFARAIGGLAPAASLAPALEKGHLHGLANNTVLRGLARFRNFPLFKPEEYLDLNAPLRATPGLDTEHHAFTHGLAEGRSVFDRQTIANELGLRSRAAPMAAAAAFEARDTGRLSISIVHNASGNLFLSDIARCLAHDLRSAGHDVVLLDDTDDPSRMRAHNIIVAPHEFFVLGRGADWLCDDVLRRSVMYNTEQPQTVWFDRAVPFNLVSRGLIDLSCQVASIYADCMPTIHCDPCGPPLDGVLPHPRDPIVRVLPRAAQGPGATASPMEARAIDVSFFGGLSTHRERFFAKTARFFADYKTLLYCRRNTGPLLADEGIDLMASARHVAFHSKLVLNIHRDEFGFFEWHRIVRLGIEAGAVVVSEPCLPHPYLRPNVHYFEESGRHIQNLVEWLLRTPDGQAEYRKVKACALDLVARRRQARGAGRRAAPAGASPDFSTPSKEHPLDDLEPQPGRPLLAPSVGAALRRPGDGLHLHL